MANIIIKPGTDFKLEKKELLRPIITDVLSLAILMIFVKGIPFIEKNSLKIKKNVFALQSLAS